jgi:hypothetical protein
MANTYQGLRKLISGSQLRPRTDLLTASRLDFGLTLLPVIGRQNVARILARQNIPVRLVLRVLASPSRRKIAD